jgi:hypothetical protein
MSSSVYIDDGEASGVGFGYCTINATVIPTLSSTPVARQPQDPPPPPPPPPDCTVTGCAAGKTCCTCTVTACETLSACRSQCSL